VGRRGITPENHPQELTEKRISGAGYKPAPGIA